MFWELARSAVFLACGFAFVGLCFLGWKILTAPPGIYERNRHATRLCRKHNKGRTTLEEEYELKKLSEEGVVTFGLAVKNGRLIAPARLSESALEEVFG